MRRVKSPLLYQLSYRVERQQRPKVSGSVAALLQPVSKKRRQIARLSRGHARLKGGRPAGSRQLKIDANRADAPFAAALERMAQDAGEQKRGPGFASCRAR